MKILAIALLVLIAPVAAAQKFASTFSSTEIVPGIHVLEATDGMAGGTMALLTGDDYVAMIDDGLEPIAEALHDYVMDLAGKPINFMINTHVHRDHIGSNSHFADSGTVVFAHENIRKRLLATPEHAGGASGLPVVTFAEGVTFHLNGIEARVFHLPAAHTDGDAAIHFPEVNVIHTGDLYFNYLFPYIDLDNGGSVDGYIGAQKQLLALADEDTQIIAGHGPVGSKEDLQKNLDMLIDAQARIKSLVDAGQDMESIVSANPLADYHEQFNWGFITTERMTRTLVRDLSSSQ